MQWCDFVFIVCQLGCCLCSLHGEFHGQFYSNFVVLQQVNSFKNTGFRSWAPKREIWCVIRGDKISKCLVRIRFVTLVAAKHMF